MKTVGLKELNDATGEIVRGVVDRAEEIVILDRGRKVAKLIPYAPSTEPSLGEIMREVWARPRPEKTVANPIIAEGRRRTCVHRVRR